MASVPSLHPWVGLTFRILFNCITILSNLTAFSWEFALKFPGISFTILGILEFLAIFLALGIVSLLSLGPVKVLTLIFHLPQLEVLTYLCYLQLIKRSAALGFEPRTSG